MFGHNARCFFAAALAAMCMLPGLEARAQVAATEDITDLDPQQAASLEAKWISGARQLTFEGRRAGEGYFSRDGSQMVFQSERIAGNPFYQIFLMSLETGDVEQISPGQGKTTCAWIHPAGDRVLFASTHQDPDAKQKQADEIALRESGQQRRYAWDYDQHYDLFSFDRKSKTYTRLTTALGYDAEGSWSPDGKQIAFASNRLAYSQLLGDEDRELFERDPSYMMDIFVMDADGTNLRRLTDSPGYDGGPFFSPDGKRICWRRFSPNGAVAEIMTMKTDGSDQRQLTRLGAMSWAPYYHPSGEYLIFTTNLHGFNNFELYLVDVQGKSPPVRVTHTSGFDGLPVFLPNGRQIAWTTNRTAQKQSQIFLGDWNHQAARQAVGTETASHDTRTALDAARESSSATSVSFAPNDIGRHVDYLCRDELAGRMTGTRGESLATAYVAAYLDSLSLQPAGDQGSWYQSFEFTAGVDLGQQNELVAGGTRLALNQDWRPVSFAQNGEFADAPVAFAGYGMAAPAREDQAEYDSYVHLDVRDKWVLAFRYLPEDVDAERRQFLGRPSQLRFKATLARDKGARGLILVSGPNANNRDQLVPLRLDGTSGSGLPVISVTDAVAQRWLSKSGKNLKQLQDKLDSGEMMMGFEIEGLSVSAKIDINKIRKRGRNVLGRLQAGPKPSEQVIVVGAHVDHLGQGAGSSSLARADEQDGIHYGADDNASGVAAMLEVAEFLVDEKQQGRLAMKRDIIFAAWSGEELGLIGSNHFAKTFHAQFVPHDHSHAPAHHPGVKSEPPAHRPPVKAGSTAANGDGHAVVADKPAAGGAAAHHGETSAAAHEHGSESLHPAIAACINMDMVGRLKKKLVLQGVGSSSIWRGEIERRNVPVGLPITLQADSYVPTDASVFFMHGVPILSAFTGSHSEYHTPRDTPEKLNYEGAAKIAKLMGLITRSLVVREAAPDFIPQAAPEQGQRRASLRAYLGTIPDYAEEVKGVKLGGVSKNSPAETAGLKGSDVVVELGGKKIENIYDYTYAIEALKIGQKVKVVVERKGQRITLEIVPGSRE